MNADNDSRMFESVMALIGAVDRAVSASPDKPLDASFQLALSEVATSTYELVDALIFLVGKETMKAAELQSAKVSLRIALMQKSRRA